MPPTQIVPLQDAPVSQPSHHHAFDDAIASSAGSLQPEQVEVRSGSFSIHPESLNFSEGLHQDLTEGQGRRNAEDILHSQVGCVLHPVRFLFRCDNLDKPSLCPWSS